jgi:hypothetical protein
MENYSILDSKNVVKAEVKLLSKIKKIFVWIYNLKKVGKYIELGNKIFPISNVYEATLFYVPITAVVYSSSKSFIKIQIRKWFNFNNNYE